MPSRVSLIARKRPSPAISGRTERECPVLLRRQSPVICEPAERECRALFVVRSVSEPRRPLGRIERHIRARSPADPEYLFGYHDPLACSELVINSRIP
jgi:hypothetical protein